MNAATVSLTMPGWFSLRRIVIEASMFLVVGYAFFFRGFSVAIAGVDIPLIVLLPLCVGVSLPLLISRKRNAEYFLSGHSERAFVLFCIVSLLAVLIGMLMNPGESIVSARFGYELIANFGIYFVAYFYMLQYGALAVGRLIFYLQIASLMWIAKIAILIPTLESIRRIGAGGEAASALPIAVNHLGHALAVVTILSAYALVQALGKNRKWARFGGVAFNGILMAGSLLAMTLTGSKAALIGVVFSVLLVLLWLARDRGKSVLAILAVLYLTGTAIVMSSPDSGRFAGLVERFSVEGFYRGVGQRLPVFERVTDSIALHDTLIGQPWRYEKLASVDPIHYPHNILLSLVVHLGIVSALLFFYNLVVSGIELGRSAFRNISPALPLTLLGVYATCLVYALTSGRLTRIMTIFAVLGLMHGLKATRTGASSGASQGTTRRCS